MRRFAVGAAAALLLLTLASAPAFAGSNGSISVSPSTIEPGGTIHVSGEVDPSACDASESATLTGDGALFPPDGFGPSTQRNAQGSFALDYTVPTTTPAGDYRIGLRCGGGNVGAFAPLTVAGAPVGGAATGGGGSAGRALPWTLVGLGSLTLAALLAAASRTRLTRSI
jgi:hypothetical protein